MGEDKDTAQHSTGQPLLLTRPGGYHHPHAVLACAVDVPHRLLRCAPTPSKAPSQACCADLYSGCGALPPGTVRQARSGRAEGGSHPPLPSPPATLPCRQQSGGEGVLRVLVQIYSEANTIYRAERWVSHAGASASYATTHGATCMALGMRWCRAPADGCGPSAGALQSAGARHHLTPSTMQVAHCVVA